MKLLKDNFRIWWQKPADPTQRDVNREITQLELFYDLVYVAIIIQLTHLIAGHISFWSIFAYLGIFLMIFWAWFNGSLYHELHWNKDLKTRVFIFLQMISLIGMWIFIHNAFWEWYKWFALSYTIFLSILTFLWWRTWIHSSDYKPIAKPFVILFCIITLTFFISIFTPINISYIIWFTSIFISLVFTLFHMSFLGKNVKKEQIEAVKNIWPSFVERFGLLTIIVLWEWVISTISGSTHIHHWTFENILNIIWSFNILIGIWWIFFDFISRKIPKKDDISKAIWLGLHFPLLASLGLINAWILNLLEYSKIFTIADKLIIIIPLIVFLICCIWMMRVIEIPKIIKILYKNSQKSFFLAIFALIILIFLPLWKTSTLWLSFLCLCAPIVSSFFIWVKWKSEK